jgi:hypothetical protein
MHKMDLVGQRFGCLTVITRDDDHHAKHAY